MKVRKHSQITLGTQPNHPNCDLKPSGQFTSQQGGFKLAYNIPQLSEASGIGRSSIYEDIRKGVLKSVMVGGRRLVRREDAEAWLRGEAE